MPPILALALIRQRLIDKPQRGRLLVVSCWMLLVAFRREALLYSGGFEYAGDLQQAGDKGYVVAKVSCG